MKLRTLLERLNKLPERCLDYEVIYEPDETCQDIVNVEYDDRAKVVLLIDEWENK